MRTRPDTMRAMSRVEALAVVAEMLARADYCSVVNRNEAFPFHIRYQAAIARDDCMDAARAAQNYIRDHCCREG